MTDHGMADLGSHQRTLLLIHSQSKHARILCIYSFKLLLLCNWHIILILFVQQRTYSVVYLALEVSWWIKKE